MRIDENARRSGQTKRESCTDNHSLSQDGWFCALVSIGICATWALCLMWEVLGI